MGYFTTEICCCIWSWHPTLLSNENQICFRILLTCFYSHADGSEYWWHWEGTENCVEVILDSKYLNYDQACQTLLTESLQSRRKTLALKFALNTYSCSKDLHTTNWGIWSHLRNHSAIPRVVRTLLCHTWLIFLMITLPSHNDRDYFNVLILILYAL